MQTRIFTRHSLPAALAFRAKLVSINQRQVERCSFGSKARLFNFIILALRFERRHDDPYRSIAFAIKESERQNARILAERKTVAELAMDYRKLLLFPAANR
jgi:hypothetical protein